MTESNYNDNQELEKGPGLVCKTNFKIVWFKCLQHFYSKRNFEKNSFLKETVYAISSDPTYLELPRDACITVALTFVLAKPLEISLVFIWKLIMLISDS